MAKLLTGEQLATELGLRPRTVKTLRQRGKIPAVQLAKHIFRYRLSSVEAALGKLELKAVNAGRSR